MADYKKTGKEIAKRLDTLLGISGPLLGLNIRRDEPPTEMSSPEYTRVWAGLYGKRVEEPEVTTKGKITPEMVMEAGARSLPKNRITPEMVMSGESPKKIGIGDATKHAVKETGNAMLGHAMGAFNMLRNMIGQGFGGVDIMARNFARHVEGMLTGNPADYLTEEANQEILDSWTREYDISDEISPRAQEHKRNLEVLMEKFIQPFVEAKKAYMEQAVTLVPVTNMKGDVVAYSRPYPILLAAIGGAGIELFGSASMAELPIRAVGAPFRASPYEPLKIGGRRIVGDPDVVTMPSMSKNLLEVDRVARHRARHGPQAGSFAEGMKVIDERMGQAQRGFELQGGGTLETGAQSAFSPELAERLRNSQTPSGVEIAGLLPEDNARIVDTPLRKTDVVEEPTVIDAKQGREYGLYEDAPPSSAPEGKTRVTRHTEAGKSTKLYSMPGYQLTYEKLVEAFKKLGKKDFQHKFHPLHVEARLVEQKRDSGKTWQQARTEARAELSGYEAEYNAALFHGQGFYEVGRGLKKLWDKATQQLINNASGESAASVEALNRLAQQHDMVFMRLDSRKPGTMEHLIPTVDRVDLSAANNQIIIAKKLGDPRMILIDAGPNLRRPRVHQILQEIQQRANKAQLHHYAQQQLFMGAGYEKAANVMGDLIRKLKDNQRVHAINDKFYVEPRFIRIGGHETGFNAKNINSLSTAITEHGIRRLLDRAMKAGMDPRVLEDAVLLAEQPSKLATRRHTPEGRLAAWMVKEFKNARTLLAKNGIKVNFKERMQQTLTTKIKELLQKEKKTVADRAKLSSYKKALDKLDDFEFVSIPKNMWLESLLENPKTETKALQILTAKQRRVLRLSDMQKYLGKKTNAIDVMSAYYQKLGNDIALSKVFKSALDEGLATLSPKEARALKYSRLPAHQAPSFAKYYMHDVLRQYLEQQVIARNNPTLWGQFASTTKMMTFDSPWYLGYYNLHQAALARGWHSLLDPRKGTVVGEWFKASKMIKDNHPEVQLAREYGLQSTPYPKQVENIIKDMSRVNQGIFRRSFSMFQDIWQSTTHPIKHFKEGSGIGRVPIVSDFYSAAWDIAWNNFDFPIRMTSYNYLRELGYSPRDAAQTAARFHGDYAAVPRNTRVALNKMLYTPTFKLAMARLHGEMLSAALKGGHAGPVGFKVSKTRALGGIGTIILTNLFFDQLMTKGFGFERKFFGRRYAKEVETENGIEELNVTFSSPQNFTFKYAERLAKMFEHGFDPKTAERVFTSNKYEITPLLTILYDTTIKNRTATGLPIYNTYDDKATKWRKAAWYAVKEINSHIKMLYPDKEGMAAKKAMAQEMGASMSFVIRSLANGYLTATEIDRLNRHMENAERNYSGDLNNAVETGELSEEVINELTENYLKDLEETLGKMNK